MDKQQGQRIYPRDNAGTHFKYFQHQFREDRKPMTKEQRDREALKTPIRIPVYDPETKTTSYLE